MAQYDLSLLRVPCYMEGCSLPTSVGNAEALRPHPVIMERPGASVDDGSVTIPAHVGTRHAYS